MADRPAKRARRGNSEVDDQSSEGSDGDSWMPDEVKKRAAGFTRQERPKPQREMPRQRRNQPPSSSPEPGKRSIRLNVRAPPSRLREVTNEDDIANLPRERLSRSSKNKQPIVDDSSDGEGGDEPEGYVPQESAEDEEDEGEDGAEESDAEDTDMPDAPPPPKPAPKIRISAPSAAPVRKPSPMRALKRGPTKIKSVEEKEMEVATGDSNVPSSDDEELSEPNSRLEEEEQSEGEDEDDEDEEEEDGEEDGEEEDEENEEQEADEEDDEDEDEDEEDEDSAPPRVIPPAAAIPADDDDDDEDLSSGPSSPSGFDTGVNSRSGTPDLSKLTRRQRGIDSDGDLLALSNEAQKKKFFTEEQLTMRRAEMARRRKDLSMKRNEEEKADTLKRLLEKPAHPKRRSKAQMAADAEREEFGLGTPGREHEEEVERANRLFVRTVCSVDGTRVGVPDEWLGKGVGRLFDGARKMGSGKALTPGRMVEEVGE